MARARRIDRARGGGRRPDPGCAGADAGSVACGRHRPARRLALRRHRRPGGAQHRHRREERRLARGRRRSQRARPLGRARRRSGRRGVRAAGVLRSPRALCGRSVRCRPRRRIHRQPGRLPRERRHVDVSGGRSRSRRDDGGARAHRRRRAGRPAHLQFGAVLRNGAARLERRRDDARADPSRGGSLGGARRARVQGEGHPAGAALGAHRGGAQTRPHRDGASRFGRADERQSARRDRDGHRPHRAFHGRRRDHRRQAGVLLARES